MNTVVELMFVAEIQAISIHMQLSTRTTQLENAESLFNNFSQPNIILET